MSTVDFLFYFLFKLIIQSTYFIIFCYSFKSGLFYHAYLLNKDSAENKHRIAYLHYIQIGVNLQDGIMNLQRYSENKNKLLPSLLLQRRQQFFQLHRRKNGIYLAIACCRYLLAEAAT